MATMRGDGADPQACRRGASAPGAWRGCLRLLAASGLAATLAGCAPATLLNAFVPTAGVASSRDIRYGEHARNLLDVYRPADAPAALRPVVLFFYGGAWQSGSRRDYLFVAEALVSRGFVVVIPDYRLYPEVVFPQFMDDAAAALAWTQQHAAEYGGDPRALFVMGHSAGAQIAALLAFDDTYRARAGIGPGAIRGLVSLAGPMDFLPLSEKALERVFPEPVRAASQPIAFVSGREPPALFLHGEDDTRVGIHNSRNIAARIRARGAIAETQYYPGMGHIGIVLALAAPLREGKPVLGRIAEFIARHTRSAHSPATGPA